MVLKIFELLGEIAVKNDEANRAIEETTQKADEGSTRTSSAFDKIGAAALGIGKFVVTAGLAMGGAFVAAIEGTREYRAQMGLLDAAFQASGHSSTEAKNTYSELNAVLGDTEQAVEAAQHIALIADNEKEMNELVSIGTGVFSQFGASLPLEGLFEAVNHTASLGEVQGSLADALEWSGITVEDFNKKLESCTTEEERQDLIMKTLKDTYGAASEQYKETNKDIMEARKAQERLTDAFSELGRVGEPILTAVKNAVAGMVEKAVPLMESFIKKVKDARKWMQENKNTVDAWKAAIVGASVAIGSFLLILNWGKIMAAATTAIKATRAAILLFNAALKANVIGLVVSLIAGLVAAFVYLWQTNDDFRAFWIGLWDKLKSVCSSGVKWIKGKFDDIKDMISNAKKRFEDLKKSIKDKIDGARDAVKSAIDKIKGFFNFKWSLPKLKLPTFSIKGKFDLNPPSVPKLSIKWNATGAVFDKPTIFGTRLGLQGVGEAGKEAIAPIDTLKAYVRDAVRAETNGMREAYARETDRLIDFLRRVIPKEIRLDTGEMVAALAPGLDHALSDRMAHSKRGG
jgi:hypothetical protein